MTENSALAFVKIEQPFGLNPPVVHCPICGQSHLVRVNHVYEMNPCKHLAYVYMGEVGDFSYESDDFINRKDKFTEEVSASFDDEDEAYDATLFGLDTLKQNLNRMGYGKHLLSMEITYGGMACGPVWYTDVYGFDYESIEE